MRKLSTYRTLEVNMAEEEQEMELEALEAIYMDDYKRKKI